MALTLEEKQQKLAECSSGQDFFDLYTLIFKEPIPETANVHFNDELDIIIDAIINDKKIPKEKLPELWD